MSDLTTIVSRVTLDGVPSGYQVSRTERCWRVNARGTMCGRSRFITSRPMPLAVIYKSLGMWRVKKASGENRGVRSFLEAVRLASRG